MAEIWELEANEISSLFREKKISSKEIIDSKNLDFNILKPLINETVNKIHKLDPIKAQTGPARRNDMNIMKMHENMLKNEEINSLYMAISKMIKEKYGN